MTPDVLSSLVSSFSSKLNFFSTKNFSLIRKSDGVVIAHNVFGASSFVELSFGLMFRSLKKGSAMLFFLPFVSRISLHMFFVFKPLDVIVGSWFLDGSSLSFKIIALKKNLRPFSFFSFGVKSDFFVELPVGTIDYCSLKPDDVIVVEF